jgi:anti-anti-sigma regulatory factor
VLAARTLQERGGDIILPSPQPIVARMLSLLGADQMIQVQPGSRNSASGTGHLTTPATGCPGDAR